ncbi:uncharacterized protein LOC123514660 isoform X1 [Portunus trituberculatus]|uniref:uncharacterized protein LOC123514660 isoform X1 n=1 Tax=Portunus trituberculatus TaxID=210409 RepID=UPI001E1CC9FC|nr:uncharacterized protein LOC123514660 isoform X1 [Portunus trituberculatus]
MPRMVKMAVVVVVVVVIGGDPGGKCRADPLKTNCNTDTEIQISGEEKLIHSESITEDRWSVTKNMFMVPLIGFESVRAEVTTNMGTFPAWFPVMDHCTPDNTQWWRVIMEVNKHTNSALFVTLAVYNCLLSCELTTGVKSTSESKVEIQNLKVFGRGTSRWTTNYPPYPCKVQEVANPTTVTLSSCTDTPPISSAFPSHSSPEKRPAQRTAQRSPQRPVKWTTEQATSQPTQKPTQQPAKGHLSTSSPPTIPSNTLEPPAHQTEVLTPTKIGVVVVVVMVVVVVVVVVILMVRRRGRQENEEGSQMTHYIQEIHVTRNSLYESFDQHFSGPGKGDAPPNTQR